MTQDSQSPQLFLDVAPDSQRVQAGEEAVFLITLENRGREAQAQNLQLTGLPEGWYRLDFDSRTRAFPGERRSASLLVTVPSEAEAARLSFTVTATAGSDQSTTTCSLEVLARGGVAAPTPTPTPPPRPRAIPPGVSVDPRTLTWRGAAQGSETVTVTVRNVGGEDATYQLAVAGLASHWYKLTSEVSVPARQAVSTPLVITPPPQARQGSYDFAVNATLADDPDIRGEATCNLTVAAPEEEPVQQRAVSAVAVEETVERPPQTPAMPPEVSLGPRSTFRFGPGEVSSQATLTVANRSRLIERYQILIRGIDEDWYQLSQSEISLQPDGEVQVQLRLTPRTGAQFPAGDYSFRVRVAPLSFPDSFAEVVGTLQIAGTMSFDARVAPNRARGRKEKFKLTLLNTGGLPISPWLEASDPQGLCKFKYDAPSNLAVGEEAVVPIWVGSTRQGLAGTPKTLDFRLRVSPAGGGSQTARTFDAAFIHQPFLGPRMLFWCLLAALVAVIVGMLIVIGFSSVSNAATVVKCGFDDDYQDPSTSDVFIKDDCGGAPLPFQKGLFSTSGGVDLSTPTPEPEATPEATADAGPTEVASDCQPDSDLGLAVGDDVVLRVDAIVRDAPDGTDTGRRGLNMAGTITAGPECAADLVWWEVKVGDETGWTAEQTGDGIRLILEPEP
jgi:hypothetical protein